LYISRVAGRFEGGVCEVRTGHRTTNLAHMTRMGDRFSTWGVSNGLQSLIPTLLTSGLLGYPFTLPDMIGGNAYFNSKPVRKKEKR
jgi:myogenesis-regulating glycosidase